MKFYATFLYFSDNIDFLYELNLTKDGAIAQANVPDGLMATKRVRQESDANQKTRKEVNLRQSDLRGAALPSIHSFQPDSTDIIRKFFFVSV